MLSSRPLVSVQFVQTVLDVPEDTVVELAEEGLIAAWDIGACGTVKSRREIRLLSAGLTFYAATQRTLPVDLDAVAEAIMPPDAPLTTVTLRSALNCSAETVRNLVNAKAFNLLPGEKMKTGPGNAAKVSRSSALAWLKSRAI